MAIGEELDYDHTLHARNRGGDDKLAVRFFKKAKQNPEKTQTEGRPIFEEVDYIQIMVPGDRTSIIVRPVGPGDEARFRKQYEHWKATQNNDLVVGTPLEAWGILNMAQIEEFRYFGIRTVENMADLRDDVVGRIMGATTLKQKAKIFVEASKAEAPMKAMREALETRDTELSALKQAVADQAKIIEQLRLRMPAE
jgi:hypothetical protein